LRPASSEVRISTWEWRVEISVWRAATSSGEEVDSDEDGLDESCDWREKSSASFETRRSDWEDS
jgi:hypothetical protein